MAARLPLPAACALEGGRWEGAGCGGQAGSAFLSHTHPRHLTLPSQALIQSDPAFRQQAMLHLRRLLDACS